jgi:phosphocarrier protein
MDPSVSAPNGGPLRRKVVITSPEGLHLRPMRAFVELASKFQCQVRVQRNDLEPVDGKSMFGMMLLGAEQGSELTVEVDGPDGSQALDQLVELLNTVQHQSSAEDS